MNAARTLKTESGFSLIELMIVVAIIGILATIAIPNFNKFQAKAKQSEAKTALSNLHGAMKGFHAEWNTYRADLRDIGYSPEGRLTYHVGFAGAESVAPTDPFQASTAGGAGAGTCVNTGVGAATCGMGFTLAPGMPAFAAAAAGGSCAAGANPTQTTFVATAIGNIGSTTTNDVWTITQAKRVCNNQSGI